MKNLVIVSFPAKPETLETLKESIEGADMLFIAAGMGGGTGTGAAPVIAQIARDLGILTVAVVTKPFDFEGPERMSNAQEGIDNLEHWVDSLIVIPNSKLRVRYHNKRVNPMLKIVYSFLCV